MELKIKIKEVKKEVRELTIEERCLVTVARDSTSKEYRDEARARLDSIGLIHSLGFSSDRGMQGKFRTETIRDATPEEIMVWHCMNMRRVAYNIGVGGISACEGCCMMNVDYEIIPGNCPLEDVEYPKNLLVRCMASPEVSCPHRAAPGICGLEDTDCVYAIIYRLR